MKNIINVLNAFITDLQKTMDEHAEDFINAEIQLEQLAENDELDYTEAQKMIAAMRYARESSPEYLFNFLEEYYKSYSAFDALYEDETE